MSLKVIKEALEDLKRKAHDAGDDASWNLALAAKDAIAALEKAAKTLAEAQPWAPVTVSTERWTQMRETIETIAKEAE